MTQYGLIVSAIHVAERYALDILQFCLFYELPLLS